jgi:hypothetical protein
MNARARFVARLAAVAAGVYFSPAQALEIVIQEQALTPASPSDVCIHIAGQYPGVTVENSEVGSQARICQQSKSKNLLVLRDANFVATQDQAEVIVRFHHDFAPGLNGQVIGRASLNGFFATSIGTEAPSGNRVELTAYFSQGTNDDLIQEPLAHTVGESTDLEGAVFDLRTDKQYLVAGNRTLKGVLTMTFNKAGQQMAVLDGIRVSLDPLFTLERR